MRIVPAAFLVTLLFSFFVSCTKEESFEVAAPARGSLQIGTTGDCLPKAVAGAFIAGAALTDSNYMELEVDVTTPGAYTISTDTMNGYSFTGIGNFDQPGINRIRLAASGTPTTAGDDLFTVIFDTTFCFVPVTVLPAGSTNTPATFTLQGNGDSCMAAAVSGTYVQSTPLNSNNTVAIKINVTAPGTYSVTTNTVNEFQFSGTGSVSAPGEQTIILTASGAPAIEGSSVFTISAGGTTCSFSVNVTAGNTPPPPVGDLFPLSSASWWSYVVDLNNPDDTIRIANVGTVNLGGNTYQNFEVSNGVVAFDSLYYRKSGNDYFQYLDVNELIADLETDVEGDVLIIKENPAQDESWNTDFPTTYNGSDVTLRFASTCTAANTTATVNGVTYNGVYKVTTKLQVGDQGVFTDAGPEIETYFARGIGLIYEKGNEAAGSLERHLKNYKIE